MADAITLAQFSDLHLPPIRGFSPRFWNVKRVLGYVNWQRKRGSVYSRALADRLIADAKTLRADHIAITGDLSNLGLPAEHEAALAWLRDVSSPDRVTVIPGNHDIYSRLHGDRGVRRWAAYMGCEQEESLAFPFIRRVGPLALIGLNSAVETAPFYATGALGPEQIEVAGEMLERLADEGAIRVVLIHHPPLAHLAPERRALTDAAQFQRMLERCGADLVLYGHNHRPALTWLQSRTGPVPLVCVGSGSAQKLYKEEPLAQYNLFTFFSGSGGVRIRQTVRGLQVPDGPVVKLAETVLEAPRAV